MRSDHRIEKIVAARESTMEATVKRGSQDAFGNTAGCIPR